MGNRDRVRTCVDAMNAAGIKTSLFIDPDEAQIELAAKLGPAWSSCTPAPTPTPILGPGARRSSSGCGWAACAPTSWASRSTPGHGINYVNIAEVRTLPHLHELNIGHSIISRALFTGVEEAVREMKARMNP